MPFSVGSVWPISNTRSSSASVTPPIVCRPASTTLDEETATHGGLTATEVVSPLSLSVMVLGMIQFLLRELNLFCSKPTQARFSAPETLLVLGAADQDR